MKVLCISNSGKDVPDEDRFFAESEITEYSPLKISEEYSVRGILFYDSRIDYLVVNKSIDPIWCPSSLFKVVVNNIPADFVAEKIDCGEYEWLKQEYGAKFIIGYPELVGSFAHFVGIQERETNHLHIFNEKFLLLND